MNFFNHLKSGQWDSALEHMHFPSSCRLAELVGYQCGASRPYYKGKSTEE